MGSGGGSQQVIQDPWSGVQPWMLNQYGRMNDVMANATPQYYSGQNFIGPNQYEMQALNYQNSMMNALYGTGMGPFQYSTQQQPNTPYPQYDFSAWNNPDDQILESSWLGQMTRNAVENNVSGGNSDVPDYVEGSGGGTGTGGTTPVPQDGVDHSAPPDSTNTGTGKTGGYAGDQTGGTTNGFTGIGNLGKTQPGPWYNPPTPTTQGGQLFPVGQQPTTYQSMSTANQALLGGGPASGMLGAMTPLAVQQMYGQFQGPSQTGFNPQAQQYDPFGMNPNIVQQDPNAALGQMLSGQGDYSQLQDVIRASQQPTLDMLNEDVLPGIYDKLNMTGSESGALKDVNRIVPRVMRDMNNQATQLGYSEMQRAKQAQMQGASMAMGGQLQQAGMGGQFGATQLGANQQYQQMLQQNALANLGSANQYRGDVLGLMGQYGGLSGDVGKSLQAGAMLAPTTLQQGMAPVGAYQRMGDYQRMFDEAALANDLQRYNYYSALPMEMVNWQNQILQGSAGLGGTQSMTGSSNPLLGAAGGGLAGYTLGGMFGGGAAAGAAAGGGAASGAASGSMAGPWGALIGAGLGYLASRG